jgi:hypothetical protein
MEYFLHSQRSLLIPSIDDSQKECNHFETDLLQQNYQSIEIIQLQEDGGGT